MGADDARNDGAWTDHAAHAVTSFPVERYVPRRHPRRDEQRMRNRIFHQARIAGTTFEGIISGDGPYLSCQMNRGVARGPSGLRYFHAPPPVTRRIPPLGWWVVKYCDEARIFLPDFNGAAVRTLSNEFGLPVLEDYGFEPCDDVRREYFFTSPAWDALRQWVISHPRLAKAHAACDTYLRRWYDRAIVEAKALAL